MGLAASVVMAGTALAQDKSAVHQGGLTNSIEPISFSLNSKTEPTLLWGASLSASGLLVDFIEPQPTLNLFNPLAPAPVVTGQTITVRPPATTPPANDDLANHQASLVFLKLSFP